MSIKKKLGLVLVGLGVLFVAVFSLTQYQGAMEDARQRAKDMAMDHIARSVEMFMVSTRRFHEDFQKNKNDPEKLKAVLHDWNRTIFAVDQAVITDHGEGKTRVRLIGDSDVFGFAPLGGDENIGIRIPFERDAGARIAKGEPMVETFEDGFYRVAVPLPSQHHEGCAECHFSVVKSDDGIKPLDTPYDLKQNIVLGTLNAYVPMTAAMAAAKDKVLWSAATISVMVALFIASVLTFLHYIINRPVSRVAESAKQISQGDLDASANLTQKDEIGAMDKALQDMVFFLKGKMYWYENILNAIPFPVSVTDNDMHWTFLNKAVEDLAKVKASEMLGKHCKNWNADICDTDECGVRCAERSQGQGRSYFTQPQFPGREFLVDATFIYNNDHEKIGHIEVIQDITETNELKRKAEQALKDGLLQAAEKLESVVEILTSASEELTAQIQQSSEGAEEQAKRMSEVATAMEEMNASVLEVARSASQTAQTSEEAKVKSTDGLHVVEQVMASINQVSEQSQEVRRDMDSLGAQAQAIGRIMDVITDIADQTNLLALNAAIEAARAGEAGRGFAVVADEVRKLAEKTMDATKEVGDAIRGIQEGATRNIDSVERTNKVVEETTELAANAGEALKEIASLVDSAAGQVGSIATASEEQSATSEEINQSVDQVNTISMENSDTMRQSADAVSELANQALVLKTLVDDMKKEGERTD